MNEQEDRNEEIKDYVAGQTPPADVPHFVAGPGAPGWMPPAPPAPPAKKKGLSLVATLIIIGVVVVGGLAFGGYTLIHNQAEKTACEQLADDTVYTVNPSHAWDLYEAYMAAPSGSSSERTALNAVGSFCSDRGVSLSRASWYTGSASSTSSSSSTTTQQQQGNSYSSHPTFPVTQDSDSGSTQMTQLVAADARDWPTDNGGSTMTVSGVCERNIDNSSWQFNCNITFNNGSYGSYWTSFHPSISAGYDATRRTY